MKLHSALTLLIVTSSVLVSRTIMAVPSVNGHTIPDTNLTQTVQAPATLDIRYRPFSFAYPLPQAGFTILGYASPNPVRPHDVISILKDSDRAMLWDTLNPQEQRAKPSKRHPGVGRFDQSCLEVNWPNASCILRVDEKGIVSNGDRYFKLSTPAFRRLDHLLNDLWYTESLSNQKHYSRENLDLTLEQIKG